jgi:MarR family transcriptional regulator, transcriptional regulator for hemolysin
MVTSAPNVTSGPDLSMLLAQASHALNVEMTARLEQLGISPRGYCVLAKALPGDLTQGEIAELADLDKTTMVVTIDQLEAAGLAKRRPSSSDRRARMIAVTAAGERMVAQARKIVDQVHGDVLRALPEHDRDAFVEGLERVVQRHSDEPVTCEHAPRRRAIRAG